jgi:hypothetical protein
LQLGAAKVTVRVVTWLRLRDPYRLEEFLTASIAIGQPARLSDPSPAPAARSFAAPVG